MNIITQSLPEVRIKVNGKPIKKYVDQNGKLWVESRNNSNYSINIKNNNSFRTLAVISVDGINIITGKPAELEPKNGYIINAYSSLDAKGWRVSDEIEKAFYFSIDKNKSYAVKLGQGKENLGVIGVAFYSEQQYTYYTYTPYYIDPFINPYTPTWTSSSSFGDYNTTAINCSTTNTNTNTLPLSMSTGKGKSIESHITHESFNVDQYLGMTTIYYDSYKNLKKRGIIQNNSLPIPFKNNGYCPDI